MAISGVRLQYFRSYTDASFEFNDGVNIIVGPNASGKTNLLEAILVLAGGNSYRARDNELVKFRQPWARLDALVGGSERIVKIIASAKPEKVYDLDGKVLRRLSLRQQLPVVLFEPNHLELLAGSPERRRDYLDALLAQMILGYGADLRAYRRTLAQRNRLLKGGRPASDQLFPWSVRLSELGGRIVRARAQLVEMINRDIGGLYRDLSRSKANVSITYQPAAMPEQYESVMLHQLDARLQTDVERGFTSFGPHREDFLVQFDGHPAGEVASRGETRTFILGLKIIELQLLETNRGEQPLVLLDDVFSELDGARRTALTAHLQPYQTFISTTDADVIAHHFAGGSTIVPIAGE